MEIERPKSSNSQLDEKVTAYREASLLNGGDYSVQKTNDDATDCKFIAAKLGYYQDRFIGNFVSSVHSSYGNTNSFESIGPTPLHRDPEILQGYWARIASITSIVTQFIQIAGPISQIVSLGSGFDTLFWRLRELSLEFEKFVEFDFSSVTAKKIHQIRIKKSNGNGCSQPLSDFFDSPVRESQHADLHAGRYHLLGTDLRQMNEFKSKLELAGLDRMKPTLFIAECVFVYMEEERTNQLLKEICGLFDSIYFLNYEQVNTDDQFSKIMAENLNRRGILLPGFSACQSLEKEKRRFLDAGFLGVSALTMEQVYKTHLDPSEVARIEKIEPLDERELLTQLLEHYCLVYAWKNSGSNVALDSALCKIAPK